MANQSSFEDFYILGFSGNTEQQPVTFFTFFIIYLIAVLWNLVIIIVVYKDRHLHTPMYIFLSNLSLVDICYITVTVPKLMYMLLSGDKFISFIQCFIQMYFFIFMGNTEIVLLSSMAYDRYIAICHPLHYHLIMNKEKCIIILAGSWVYGCGNSLFVTCFASRLHFCRSNVIQNFYCGMKALTNISCPDKLFYIIMYTETLIIVIFPFLLSLTSYWKIIASILCIKSTEGRRKAFSTCTSHLTVLTIFYGTILCMYVKPPSEHSDKLDHLLSVLYAAVTPMLNPLIYSLRNKEVKGALMRLLGDEFK